MRCVHEPLAIDVGLDPIKHLIGKFDNHKANFEKLFLFMLTIALPSSIGIVYSIYDKFIISKVVWFVARVFRAWQRGS